MVLKIYDTIINADEQAVRLFWGDRPGVSINDIDAFLAEMPEDDGAIDLYIHSAGGEVCEGWAIVDKLRATGKKITATVDGLCASMATVILLAASERRAQPHATLHIHKPYIPPYTLADAYDEDDLARMSNDLKMDTQRILDWYVERTGTDRETLAAIMDEDRDMSADEALALGFVSELCVPASASIAKRGRGEWNKSKPSSTDNMAENKKKEGAGILASLASFLGVKVNVVVDEEGGDEPKIVITTADERELTVHIPEGQEPAVGDAADPDGEFPLEDGRIIKVVEGVIAEIVPAPGEGEGEGEGAQVDKTDEGGEPDADVEALKAENEELKAKVADLEAQLAEAEDAKASAEDKAIVTIVNQCGGAEWLDKVARSNYVPGQRKNAKDGSGAAYESSTAARLAALKAKRNL